MKATQSVAIFVGMLLGAAQAVVITDPGQGVFNFSGDAPGLSGLTWVGGNNYYAVSDSVGAPDIYPLTVGFSASGTIVSANLGGAFALAVGADPEGIAFHADGEPCLCQTNRTPMRAISASSTA